MFIFSANCWAKYVAGVTCFASCNFASYIDDVERAALWCEDNRGFGEALTRLTVDVASYFQRGLNMIFMMIVIIKMIF